MRNWGLNLEGLGSLVMELNENQMMSYLIKIKIFTQIIGRYPDYFEEKAIIKNVKKEKPDGI